MDLDMNLKVKSEPNRTLVWLNGELVPTIRSLNVDFHTSEWPLAQIELDTPHAEIEGRVRAYLHPATVKILKAAGWTPPPEEEDEPEDEWLKVVALLLLASGGTISVPERLLVETDYSRLTINSTRVLDEVFYNVEENNEASRD